jgi:phage gpG-like protein
VKVEVVGADRFASTCASAAKELRAMAATNRAVASAIRASAHPPILTGRLAASLTTEASDTEAVVSSSLVYAPIQERRHGFLAAALASQESAAIDAHLRHVDEALGTVRGA